jgi:hypothetical protein
MKCSMAKPGYCAPLVSNKLVDVQYAPRRDRGVAIRKIAKLTQNVCFDVDFWASQKLCNSHANVVK